MKKPQTQSANLARVIESEILSGACPPGTRLDEQSLATRFGVSRTPVREALRYLSASGIVQIRAHQGAIVRELTLAEFLEMFQVIAELEGLAARLAARRIEPHERIALRASHEACERHARARAEDAFIEENDRFHEIVLTASRNSFLGSQVHELVRRANPYRRYVTKQPGVMEKSVEEHGDVLAAIERGDGPAAHDLMRAHLNMIGEEAGDFVAFFSKIEEIASPSPQPAARPVRTATRPARVRSNAVSRRR